MKYAYVKFVSGVFEGVSVTDTTFSTPQTGAFGSGGLTTANCYSRMQDAVTYGALSSGDRIYISDLHNITTTVALNGKGIDLDFVCVSDTNCDQSSIGAQETSSSTMTLHTGNADKACFEGVIFSITGGGDFLVSDTSTYTHFRNCTFKQTEINRGLFINDDGANVYLTDCTLNFATNSNKFYIGNGCRLYIDNLKAHASHVLVNSGLIDTAGAGGLNLIITNTDITKIVDGYLMRSLATSDDSVFISMNKCKVDKSLVVADGSLRNVLVNLTSCDLGSAYHFFEYRNLSNGEYAEDTDNYLTYTYDGVNGASILASTSGLATVIDPLRIKLAELPARNISSATSFRVNLVTNNIQLNNGSCWVEVVYPDNTYQALGIVNSTRNSDILAADTDLDSDTTNTWTSPSIAADLEQYIEADLPAGLTNVLNGTVEVWICLSEESTDVWVDPTVVIT